MPLFGSHRKPTIASPASAKSRLSVRSLQKHRFCPLARLTKLSPRLRQFASLFAHSRAPEHFAKTNIRGGPISSRPPCFRTRNVSEMTRPTSGTNSATCVQATALKNASGSASSVASATAYESHCGGFRRRQSAIRSLEMSIPMTAPSLPTILAILTHKKPGPRPTSKTRYPGKRASRQGSLLAAWPGRDCAGRHWLGD